MEDIKYSDEEIDQIMNKQPHLLKQSFKTLEGEFGPLTPEIMSRQATINIGTIGHVSHGKTTLVRAISGIQTTKHKIEKERNITYNLGYANAKLYRCSNCPKPDSYVSYGSEKEDNPNCEKCGAKLELLRHVSFVDCPGHDILMATMLNGAAVMDAALLLIAANESCPQPQTSEHFAAVENLDLKHIIIVQNKIDVAMKDNTAQEQYKQIKKFVSGTNASNSPIIPISAQFRYNVDVVIEYLTKIPIPKRDFTSPPRFIIVRSFDVNKPGCEPKNLKGGVAGGTLLRGILKLGEAVEIRPGQLVKSPTGTTQLIPIMTRIVSLQTENNNLIYAIPGGLIGVGLGVDPYLTRGDRMVGKVLGHPGHLPDILVKIVVKCHLLRGLLGVRNKASSKLSEHASEISLNEVLLINCGSTGVGGKVERIEGEGDNIVTFALLDYVCSEIGEKLAISRRIEKSWRLIGWGEVLNGTTLDGQTKD
ncbi:MAG: translation initiation factor IF-2 subunit gamma [archaeon]|nr:translation initiation factor IF-2 subunit gamma [archaeon]